MKSITLPANSCHTGDQMVRRAFLSIVIFAALSLVGSGQAPTTPPAVPAGQAPAAPPAGRGGGRGGVNSPQVNPDKTFTLRFRAPNAREVVAIGEIDGKDHPMTKKEVCGADASATINRSDFGITYGANFGFKPEVKLLIQVEAGIAS